MESSNFFQKLSAPPSFPTPPFPFVGIIALILFYVVIMHLVIDYDRLRGVNSSSSTTLISSDETSPGLSPEEIQKLPWLNCEMNLNSICAVCLDGVSRGDRCRVFTGCKHVFHAQCIDQWLLRQLTCPTCRSPFTVNANLDIV